ncbi:MAG: hypothetical protein AABZ12_10325 [Planctomycetota bacterium]
MVRTGGRRWAACAARQGAAWTLLLAGTALGGAKELEPVLRLVPADLPVIVAFENLEKFDKTMTGFVKSISPDATFGGILSDIKKDLRIGEWIDFTKPIALLQVDTTRPDSSVVVAVVPEFATKVKTVAEAREEGGMWEIPAGENRTMYVIAKGDYVVAGQDRVAVEKLKSAEGKVFSENFAARKELLEGREGLIHVQFSPSMRGPLLTGLSQGAQMAPMVGMMLGPAAGDAAMISSTVLALLDGIGQFVQQVDYLDVAVGVSEAAADVTVAAGFLDGAIHEYVVKQKPAQGELLSTIGERPFVFALGWEVPGEDSPFTDYFLDKALAAAAPKVPVNGTHAAGGENPAALQEAAGVYRELFHKVSGMNMALTATPQGLRAVGDYLGKDAAAILDAAKASMTKAGAITKGFSGGASYEESGSRKIGETTVHEYAMKFDAGGAAATQASKLLGDNVRLSLGLVEGRVRYCLGTEEDAGAAFGEKAAQPLSASKAAAATLAKLPKKRNVVLLVDPIGAMPLLGSLLGMVAQGVAGGGEPVGLSISVSGEPARLDIHLPAKTLAAWVAAMSAGKTQPT